MSQLGDAVTYFPISGTNGPPGVFLRDAQQCVSATMYVVMHPGGIMTGTFRLAPANPNRAKLSLLNSGTLFLAVEHGTQGFSPNANISPTNLYDNLLPPIPSSIVPPYLE